MLSRKQLWRRTPVSKPFSPTTTTRDQNKYNSFLKDHISVSDDTDAESNSTSQGSLKRFLSLRSCISSADLRKLDPIIKQKRSRRIRFSSYVKVCLIPTREELAHLHDDLYWSLTDCEVFKKDGVEQLKRFSKHHGISMKEAISLLFQPTKPGKVDYTDDLVCDCIYSSSTLTDSFPSIGSNLVAALLPNDSLHDISERNHSKKNVDKQQQQQRGRVQLNGGYVANKDDDDDLAVTSSSNDEDGDDLSSNATSSLDEDESLFRTGKTDIDLHMHDGAGRQPLATGGHASARQQIAWEVTWTPNESNNMNNNPSAVRVL